MASIVSDVTTQETTRKVSACLQDPILLPSHPAYSRNDRNIVHRLRSLLKVMIDTEVKEPALPPVCGTHTVDRSFLRQLKLRHNEIHGLLTAATIAGASANKSVKTARLMELDEMFSALVKRIEGRVQNHQRHYGRFRRDMVPKRVPIGSVQQDAFTDTVVPSSRKAVYIHYRSSHPKLTQGMVLDAHLCWLDLFHVSVFLVDEVSNDSRGNKIPSTQRADHVYVEDTTLDNGVAMKTTRYAGIISLKVSTFADDKDAFSRLCATGNVFGFLLHEVGHIVGFGHDGPAVESQRVEEKSDLAVDQRSVMCYERLLDDCSHGRKTGLSPGDKWGMCRLFDPNNTASLLSTPFGKGHQLVTIKLWHATTPLYFEVRLQDVPDNFPELLELLHKKAQTDHGIALEADALYEHDGQLIGNPRGLLIPGRTVEWYTTKRARISLLEVLSGILESTAAAIRESFGHDQKKQS